MDNGNHPDIKDLKRIRSLSEFSDGQLTSLSQKLELQRAAKKTCLIEYGCSENFTLYLLAGTLEATTQDKRVTRFEGN